MKKNAKRDYEVKVYSLKENAIENKTYEFSFSELKAAGVLLEPSDEELLKVKELEKNKKD